MNNILDDYTIDFSLLDCISIENIVKYKIIPIHKYDIYILIASASNISKNDLSKILSYPVKLLKINRAQYNEFYNDIDKKISLYNLSNEAIKYTIEQSINKTKISMFCDELFELAINKNASDIHIQNTKYKRVPKY